MQNASDASRPFSCKGCGLCCRWGGYVYLTDEDISMLAEALHISEEDVIAKWTQLSPNRQGLCLTGSKDEPCIFLEKNRCSIYDYRPKQCRDYPALWKTDILCPGFD